MEQYAVDTSRRRVAVPAHTSSGSRWLLTFRQLFPCVCGRTRCYQRAQSVACKIPSTWDRDQCRAPAGLRVIKDLVVDMEDFSRSTHHPPFRRSGPMPAGSGPVARGPGAYDDTTVHPVRGLPAPALVLGGTLRGAGAIVNAHRSYRHRDGGAGAVEILADADGVWRCRTIFNCTEACPRGIQVTRAILEVSAAITERGV